MDDRYIIKSLSKAEKTSFLEKLGPQYFDYMEKRHSEKQNVSLAKVLGLFQVSMKSYSSRAAKTEKMESDEADLGRDWVQNLIILENVFYNHNCSSIYDLKGSERKRMNDEAEKKGGDQMGVYLDENLRRHNASAPPLLVDQTTLDTLSNPKSFFLRSCFVAAMLRRDTDFLASNLVMDYSLLVGVDSESNCLVVAIIDYLRPYTIDKRLETIIKSSVIMRDGSQQPTVISPDDYKDRFLKNIPGYFTVVPYM